VLSKSSALAAQESDLAETESVHATEELLQAQPTSPATIQKSKLQHKDSPCDHPSSQLHQLLASTFPCRDP